MGRSNVRASFVFAFLCGCWTGHELGATAARSSTLLCSTEAVSLAVEPSSSQIDVGDGRDFEVRFAAIATFADGRRARVPAGWSIDVPEAGEIAADGSFLSSGEAGGDVTVRARAHGQSATARLGMKLVRGVVDSAVDVPAEVVARFGSEHAPVDDPALQFITPADNTLSKPEGGAPEFQWEGAGQDYFQLQFSSATSDVSVYTAGTRFVLTPSLRAWLTASNRGRTVRVWLRAVGAASDAVHQIPLPLTLSFCSAEICNGADDDCNARLDDACVEPPLVDGRGQCI